MSPGTFTRLVSVPTVVREPSVQSKVSGAVPVTVIPKMEPSALPQFSWLTNAEVASIVGRAFTVMVISLLNAVHAASVAVTRRVSPSTGVSAV